jgi:glutaredoxin
VSGYQSALEAAGATVLAFKEFGSYQGEWWAKVRHKRKTRWVCGSYGSCSGCDAFEAEFGYNEDRCEEHRYDWEDEKSPACDACKAAKASATEKLAKFGAVYLEDTKTQSEAEKEALRNLDWDSDAQPMVDWLRANAL